MTVRELRKKYLEFFESKGHLQHASGSLIPYDVTGRLDESLLFNGAGMVQFKPYFRGVAEPPHKRLTTCQKCVRTGDIDEVGDLTHLTFFEMLGNFSFGDYFKKEAIAFSWEFMTSKEWLGLDVNRLSFTVFESDDEAYECWSEHLRSVGIDPTTRVFRLGQDTNYWPAGSFTAGPPGPCGPNTEMFYWADNSLPVPTAGYTREDWIRDEGQGHWLEIWNDVFIQSEWQGQLNDPSRPEKGWKKSGMPDLPFKSVDTGMGLDRTACVLNGFKSVYDTDAFQPIFRLMESVGSGLSYGADPTKDHAMRIVADHLRTAVFCITDGILPGNSGRGYVLRRLIRRAVLKGQRVLGFDKPFFASLVEAVVEAMGGHYQELHARQALIIETLTSEENLFRRTISEGIEMLQGILAKGVGDTLPGERAFYLYDTFGFPLEVTEELCKEAGVKVDIEGYRSAMAEAQERSRAAGGMDTVYGGVGEVSFKDAPKTDFLGYDMTRAPAKIVAHKIQDGIAVVALDQTPFYAKSGGQVSDLGTIEGDGIRLKVVDVKKQEGVWLHIAEVEEAAADLEEAKVFADVDDDRRVEITRNHTATHMLQAALKEVLGNHVNQAGSEVAPDALRFDFTHGQAMSAEEIARVEKIVNERIWLAEPVTIYNDVPIDDAKKMGAMALFGEKYGNTVRVVQIGSMPPEEPCWSRELCGGIHVKNTGQIGMFKIIHEASAASGVRRITAVTGQGVYNYLREKQETLLQAAELLKTNESGVIQGIEKTIQNLREEKKKREKLASQGPSASQGDVHEFGKVKLTIVQLEDLDKQDAELAADKIVGEGPFNVALISLNSDGKLVFVAKCGDAAVQAGAHAGNIASGVAKITGGGGGGRPQFATAGGKDSSKLAEALAAAPGIVQGMIKG